jgi:hypothetical protein
MTIIIYFTEDKKNYQIIHPKTDGPNKFNGDVNSLVEHITKSDYSSGYKNYYRFEII